jgi:predicted kinase
MRPSCAATSASACARCPYTVLHCTAPLDVLRRRVVERAQRRDDASEADVAVLEWLHAVQQPLAPDELADVLEPQADIEQLTSRWLKFGGG